jgi:hypothetical protein
LGALPSNSGSSPKRKLPMTDSEAMPAVSLIGGALLALAIGAPTGL